MKNLLTFALLATALTSAHAAVIIPVNNGDFEQSVYESGTYTFHSGSYSGEPNFSLTGDDAGDIKSEPSTGDSTAIVFEQGDGSITSGTLLDHIIGGDKYVLTIDVGADSTGVSGVASLGFQANTSYVGTATITTPTATPSFKTYTVTLTGAETLALDGQSLRFRGDIVGGARTLFDNVTLTQFAPGGLSVPEPSTVQFALFGMGVLLFGIWRKRQILS